MISPLQSYRRRHGAPDQTLEALDELVQSGQLRTPEDIERQARRLGFPVAALRGVVSSYAEFQERHEYTSLCRGTSCIVSGAPEATADHDCKHVFCLGYCDRSPVMMNPEGAVFLTGEGEHANSLPSLPSLRAVTQRPIVLRRLLHGDHSDLRTAQAAGVYQVVAQALQSGSESVLKAVEDSGMRGRGGAGFPTGAKWRLCAQTPADERYVVANGDEGDPGSFIDRVLMEHDPHAIIAGMLLCAFAVGARREYIFIRSEYPRANAIMRDAIAAASAAGYLGPDILGSGFSFELETVTGRGSYVCGEETAMLNAIEGARGEVRLRPPYPAQAGLFQKPTVINNVETLVNVVALLEDGVAAYRSLGTANSSGTKTICLNRNFARPGIVEVEFGATLAEVIEEAGGGRDGTRIEAVIMGGPMGSLLLPDEWNIPVCYAAMNERGLKLGHGGLVALLEGTDYRALARHWLQFMMEESCGKCVPCRLGSRQAYSLLSGDGAAHNKAEFMRTLQVMEEASLCAFGQHMPDPLRRMVHCFGDQIFEAALTL